MNIYKITRTDGKECTCYIKEEDGVEPQLIKCALCTSAPDLYEALKTYRLWIEGGPIGSRTLTQVQEMMIDALAKADKRVNPQYKGGK